MTSPTSVPLHLLALEQAAQPGALGDLAVGGDSTTRATSDAQLRAAIVNVAGYYLRLAKTRTPTQMEALIWDKTSTDGTDHGESCAAFASLTLELAAQAVGQQSWVSGGGTYPWPLNEWADVRVDTNPDSPGITSLVGDAQAHGRWHPLGDGYQPQAGDWAVYNEHVEVVTGYDGGTLDTIGADSLPGLTVNAHSSAGPLAEQGIEGFVDNGNLKQAAAGHAPVAGQSPAATPAHSEPAGGKATSAGGKTPGGKAAKPKAGAGPKEPAGSVAAIPGVNSGAAAGSAPATAPSAGIGPGTGSAASSGPATSRTPAPGPAAGHSARQAGGSPEAAPVSAAVPGILAAGDLLGGVRAEAEGGTAQASPVPAAAIPGLLAMGAGAQAAGSGAATAPATGSTPAASSAAGCSGAVTIPGAAPAHADATPSAPAASPAATPTAPATRPATKPTAPATRPAAAPSAPSAHPASSPAARQYVTPGTQGQQAFISMVAPGAIAAQQRFGVPAAVTIAQAIEESAWGASGLAAQYHNLFGIKGAGPAGSVSLPTSEFQGGQWVTVDAAFRVYHNDAESIADHAELLATSGYYTRAMADRGVPDAFANDLTGVYATDPGYGGNLIALMKLYNLYQFDSGSAAAPAAAPAATQAPHATASAGQASHPAAAAPATAAHPGAVHASSPASPAGHQSAGYASVPGMPAPALAPSVPAVTSAPGGAAVGSAAAAGHIPGLVSPGPLAPATVSAGHSSSAVPARGPAPRGAGAGASTGTRTAARGGASVPGVAGSGGTQAAKAGRGASQAAATPRRGGAAIPGIATSSGIVTTARVTRGGAAKAPARYQPELPHAVTTAFFASAKAPLARGEHLYRDVAACTGVGWELLAAVDWMQCKADHRRSPVHGEKIGSLNHDGTSYPTKTAALTQCACDLIELAGAVYGIDLTTRRRLSVRDLASAFAAFRWGALLRRHGVSAMEFPYSVTGLTSQHQKMHWPSIDAPDAPDRPGTRFREPFGAVPIVLSLNYPATVLGQKAQVSPCSAW